MLGYQRGAGRKGEKVQGLRSIIGRYKVDREKVKSSMGNGEAKEHIYPIHGHELSGGYWWGIGAVGRGIKERKK